MTTTELLAIFANPEMVKTLSFSDKFSAGLITTVLGMGITFTALIILLFTISWMNKIINKVHGTAPNKTIALTQKTQMPRAVHMTEDDNELVVAITTAIAMSLRTTTSNIVIKNIKKIEESSPQWNREGIIEQMNSRL